MNFKQVIVVRTDLKMARGKTASQAAHASVEAMDKTNSVHSDWVREWKEKGMEKVVLKVSSFRE
ncbi:peptidyl-tRNA hydrolase, partial [Candidatus Micrarchaeota archaeon]|nr:peptidyl-tRNA hydrolase [Candidatus Micrarchaeota archaeon]